MEDKKLEKVKFAKKQLTKLKVIFTELNNGQLQVDGINYWSTTEKWYDPTTGNKGQGLNSFINHLKDRNIIS